MPKVCQLAPNRTNPGLFLIKFQFILARPPKRRQIFPKWYKFGSFSDQISVHFGSLNQTTEIKSEKVLDLSYLGPTDTLWA